MGKPTPADMVAVRYVYTPHFPEILQHLRASLLVTTYQAGKLLILGVQQGQLTISFMSFEQPMGLATSAGCIAIGSRRQLHFMVPAHESLPADAPYDGCFVPRTSLYSGAIHGHDLAWGQGGLWVVNTLFSCLSTLHPNYSFVPQWRPPFITRLIDQDRCHLNGLAMANGRPCYVTVLGETDEPAGWRPGKVNGGAILDVPSGEPVCRRLSMPHSPRLSSNRLFVLNSGEGTLAHVDLPSGRLETIERLPGYTRGLALGGQFAFVGLSKIRETAIFGGLPIGAHPDALRCGIGIVDLISGRTVATFQFHSGVEEIFAVELLMGRQNPLLAGASADERQEEVWIVPAEQAPRPTIVAERPIYAGPSEERPTSPASADGLSSEQLRARAATWAEAGRLDEAVSDLDQAIRTSPKPAALWVDLGNLRQQQGQQEAARHCYEQALEQDANSIAALQNLGYLLFNMGCPDESVAIYERLVSLAPSTLNDLLAASVMPIVYDSQADVEYWIERAGEFLRRAAERKSPVDATKSLVPTFFFSAYTGLQARAAMQTRAAAVQGQDWTTGRAAWSPGMNRKPRVGLISAYFRDHTIGRLNVGRLQAVRDAGCELIVIQASPVKDGWSNRFRENADHHVPLSRSLPTAMQTLANLQLDLLVFADVGMDALTTTLAFSRFAPIQAVHWGHPLTTGSPAIDYFLSSQQLEIPTAQEHYSERLVLPKSLCLGYSRPPGSERLLAAAVNGQWVNRETRQHLGLPLDRRLYGCPQTLFKFHPQFDPALAGILESDPEGELVLLAGRMPRWTAELARRFRRTLPDASQRVRFLPAMPNADFLALLGTCDVLLDPFPFGGGNTTLESIAVGTPVISLPTPLLAGRISQALLRQVGLEACLANDVSDYVRRAVEIARSASTRTRLAVQMQQAASRLFDNHEAAADWANTLRTLLESGPVSKQRTA